jgi:serine/threonine protein kinase/formylglycine-generating enzyme required for sulfatase activity
MPFCGECGKQYKDGLKFCPHCGTPNELFKAESKKQKAESSTESTFRMDTVLPNGAEEYKTRIRGASSYGVLNLEDLPAGHVIDDRYEIKEKVGQGGFGAVYRVFDRTMEIDKALKVIPQAVVSDAEALYDLQQEAKTMIALNHPNIVRVFDFHNTGSIKYIDMEYVPGKTLTQFKLECPKKQMPEVQVKEYAIKIAQGMAYAHQHNVLHKDIKPQNIKVTPEGAIKIMDFGIAETVRTSMSRIQNTSSSGTLVYMSPEQIKGKDVGKESDIYSFGAMLYELLSGHPPFYKGDISYQILNEEPGVIEHVSEGMKQIIMRCLQKNYQDRYKCFESIVKNLGGKIETREQLVLERSKTSSSSFIKKLVGITIITDPESVVVTIDSKNQWKTPFKGKLTTGRHSISLSKEGYESINSELDVNENSDNEFFIEMKSAMGTITVETEKPGFDILLNGENTSKKTPFTFNNIIPDVDYDFKIESEKYYSNPETIRISEKEHKIYKPHLKQYPQIEGMIFVKGGTFQMGIINDHEALVHSVTVSSFLIGKNEVTQKEWRDIMGKNPSFSKKKKVIEKGFLGMGRKIEKIDNDNHPVERINWYDAVAFCNKKSELEGLKKCYSGRGNNIKCDFTKNGYRLPTEAEWEFAARGGRQSMGYTYSGSNTLDDVAWYSDNSGGETHPVGRKQANELGIYDMSGNVWEWCWDWFGSYRRSSQTNPKGDSTGSDRVVRGGSWNSITSYSRVAFRTYNYPASSYSYIGFRLVRSAI